LRPAGDVGYADQDDCFFIVDRVKEPATFSGSATIRLIRPAAS